MRRKLTLAGILILWVLTLHSAAPISIRVTPRVGMRPHTVSIQVRIEPNVENRVLCLVWGLESEDGIASSSCQELNGSQRSFLWSRVLRLSGMWVIAASVTRSDGSISRTSETVNVVGGF